MSAALAYDEIISMDQINLDDYPDVSFVPCVSNVIKSKSLLGKKIYLYREKEVKSVISKELKAAQLELKGAEGGKAKFLSVFRNLNTGDIYLSDKIYNTHSFRLIAALGREYDAKNKVVIPRQYSVKDFYDVLDLSLCNLPDRRAFFTKDGKIAFRSVNPDHRTLKVQSRRDSLMSNTKIKYVYSSKDNLVHDKSCEKVHLIENECFMGSDIIPEGRIFCPDCYLNSLIRKGCEADFKKVNLYRKFFRDGCLKTRDIEKLIVDCNAQIHMDTPDILQIKCNEDSWFIKADSGKYMLFHNSYVILNENERYIGKYHGFHPQGSYSKLYKALDYLEGYTWEKHLAHKAEVEKAKELQLKREKSFFNRLRKWFRNLFSYFKSEVRNDNSSRF